MDLNLLKVAKSQLEYRSRKMIHIKEQSSLTRSLENVSVTHLYRAGRDASHASIDLIVGVPGAFTPPCSSHVPGYVENADKLAEKGIKVRMS